MTAGVLCAGTVAAVTTAIAGGGRAVTGTLTGYEEVPAVSTTGHGHFQVSPTGGGTFEYTLEYEGLQGSVTQAHVHFAQPGVNGGIAIWLCSNLASPPTPAGIPACPASGTVTGTITAASVVGPAGQGIAPGELPEMLAAVRAGRAYANVHSSTWPGGEIRAQLGRRDHGHGHGHDLD